MRSDLASKVGVYARMVESLHLYDEDTELTALLVRRDAIHDRLRAGETLTTSAAILLDRTDTRLLERREPLVRRFPGLFAESAGIPNEYWWWHPDRGPRARHEATVATQESGAATS